MINTTHLLMNTQFRQQSYKIFSLITITTTTIYPYYLIFFKVKHHICSVNFASVVQETFVPVKCLTICRTIVYSLLRSACI